MFRFLGEWGVELELNWWLLGLGVKFLLSEFS